MVNIKVRPSVYSYEDDMKLFRVKTDKKSDLKVPGEAVVIQALFGYRFLTKSLIEKNLELYRHGSLDADTILPLLVEKGTIDRFTIKTSTPPYTDFYTLSKSAMEENYGMPPYTAENIQDILADMALSQFHMAALSSRKVRQYFHNHEESAGSLLFNMRSLLFLKARPPLYIAALPSPRNNDADGIKKLIKELVLTNEYMTSKAGIYRSYLQVIICESESQMKELSKILSTTPSTRDIYTLYSLDEESRGYRNPLERIHAIRWDENGANIETIDLIGERKKQ